MGLFPKYRKGDYGIGTVGDKDRIFRVYNVTMFWEGLRISWVYQGRYFEVKTDDQKAVMLDYSTSGSIHEKDFVPLEDRIDMKCK